MKKFSIYSIIPILLTLPNAAAAAPNDEYTPLVVIKAFGIDTSTPTLGTYLAAWFRIGIIMAGVLAVIMITLGGIQYMTTDAVFQKDEGKKRITAALGGLILALSSVLILNTIDSDLTSSSTANGGRDFDVTTPTVTVEGEDVGGPSIPTVVGTEGNKGAKGEEGPVGDNGNGTGNGTPTPGTPGSVAVTTFGGPSDVRVTPGGYALTRSNDPNKGQKYEDAKVGNSNITVPFYYALDSNNKRIKMPNGNKNGFTGYYETGSVSGERLGGLDPTTDLYVAYPLFQNIIPGLPQMANTGTANKALKNKKVRITATNGNVEDARIIDRGPAVGNKLDGSAGLWVKLGIPNGSLGNIESLELINA